MAFHGQISLPGPEQACRLRHDDYTVAIICPMGDELSPVLALLDESHETLGTSRDQNAYKLGRMGHHNVVVAGMPEIGNSAASMVVTQLLNDFNRIRFGLLVGIGGGIPDEDYDGDEINDIRLGDVVVSHSRGAKGGVIQFDRGKSTTDGFVVTGHQSKPPHVLAANVEILKASHNLHGNRISRFLDEMLDRYPGMREKYSFPGSERDCVFEASYTHEGGKTCKKCDISRTIERKQRRTDIPRTHYGTIGSSNTVIKDSRKRNKLRDMGILCVEMEAAGLMEAFPCLVIRGISDYADSHKNKKWQPYAAATAAAYSKELLLQIPQGEVQRTQSIADTLEGFSMKIDWVDQRTRLLMAQTQSVAEMTILEWLSSNDVNFSSLQNESQQTHTTGTGQWLLDHKSYRDWRNYEPGLFWLHGVAGCGKTILCSTIIRDIQQNFLHSAYWYFQFDNHVSQDVSQMLRSIIRQLSLSPLPEETRSLYDRHGQRGSEPSLEELVIALSCTIELLAHDVYIVLDALDECLHKDKKGQRDQLLHCINNLIRTHPNLHLLVTSRPEPDIERDLRSVASCDLDIEQPIRSDVERFVKVTLEDHGLNSWTKDVRDQIIANLLEHEERRFRWADLQIKRFAQCPNTESLKKAMNSVPRDLEAAYRQAFDAIDEDNTAHVTKIMMWLAMSLEPLSADQITAVAGFRDPDYVLKICSTLLVTIIDEDTSRIIKLAHFSVKEFLVLKLYENSTEWYRFTMESANKSIALFALQGLLHPQNQLEDILLYAAQYWPRHAIEGLKIDDQMELEEQICLFFSGEYRQKFLRWLRIYNPDNVDGYQAYRAAGPLYYASLLGFHGVVAKIWVNDSQSLKNEGRYGNALNAAAISGNATVLQWLLWNCQGSACFLDLVRVAREISANVMECIVEICRGLGDVVITEDVVQAAAENESSGQQVIRALLENRGDEVRITEDVVIAAAGNWDNGPQVIELLLKQKKDEVRITRDVVKAAFSNKYSGWQVLKVILENTRNETQITEYVIRTAIEYGESGQQVMELLFEKRQKENNTHFTEEITSLIVGNFDVPAVRLFLEKAGEEVMTTETIIKAAAKSHLYGPQVMEMLLEVRDNEVQLTEGVIIAAAGNSTSGRQALEVLLRRATFKFPMTETAISIIGERFDAHTMKLLVEKNPDDILLTEEVLKGCASNRDNGQQVLEVLINKTKKKVHHITEQVVKAAARNRRSGQQVMELLLSERADTMQMTDTVFIIIICNWDGARLMNLLTESIEDDDMERRVACAEKVRNMAAMEALLKRRDHLDSMYDLAISHGDTETAGLLFKKSRRYMDRKRQRNLCRFTERGLTDLVELLLKNGVGQIARPRAGRTLLMHASACGHTAIVDLLLTYGADLTLKDYREKTALSIASSFGRLQVVNKLLQSGADHTVRDQEGWTPLMLASEQGTVGVVDLLLTFGADHTAQNKLGGTALYIAAACGHEEVVDLLLERGADITARTKTGRTPLMCASENGAVNAVKLLLMRGADHTLTDNKKERALDKAIDHGHLEVVAILLGRGADPQAMHKYGDTTLHNASLKKRLEVARLFIENRAALAPLKGDGYTALQSASSIGNIRMVELLLRSGVNPSSTGEDGTTALHRASVQGHAEVVKMLIDYGATIDWVCKSDCTPLHAAASEGHTKVVEILSLMIPWSRPLRDARGFTALEVAARLGHEEVVEILRR